VTVKAPRNVQYAMESWKPNKLKNCSEAVEILCQVTAEVCLHCGERSYSEDGIKTFEEIRDKLQKQDFSQLKSVG